MSLVAATRLLIGLGFLGANVMAARDVFAWRRRRTSALVTWTMPRAPRVAVGYLLGTITALLALFDTMVMHQQAFAEVMMTAYFQWLAPARHRIARGFYAEGIWTSTAFVRYTAVGGVTWREGKESAELLVSTTGRDRATRLIVPLTHYGACRRVLRDHIGAHAVALSGLRLDLGAHDARDDA